MKKISPGEKTALLLFEATAIRKEQIDAYAYSINGALEFLFFWFIIGLTGIITGTFILSIFELTVIVALRSFCGGAHAPTAASCMITSYIGFVLILWLSRYYSVIISNMTDMLTAVILTIICVLSPVPCKGKPLSAHQRHKNKLATIIVCYVIAFIYIYLRHRLYLRFCCIIFLTTSMIVILQLLELLQNRGDRK